MKQVIDCANFFFDGLFADISMQNPISNSQESRTYYNNSSWNLGLNYDEIAFYDA